MKILIDIPEDINRELKIYKLINNCHTLQNAVNKVLAEKFVKKTIAYKKGNLIKK